MTALDLGTADRILTPPSSAFTSIDFGEITLTPASAPHPVATIGDVQVIPRDAPSGASVIENLTDVAQVLLGAVFIAVYGPDAAAGEWQPYYGPTSTYGLGLDVAQMDYAYAFTTQINSSNVELTTPHDAGLTVYAIVNSGTEAFVANSRDGVISTRAAVTSPGFDTWTYLGLADGSGGTAAVAGIWQYEGITVSQTDALDTIAAIVATIEGEAGPAPILASGTSGWGITAHPATVTVGTLADPPTPPDLDGGGAVTPPTPPDPPTLEELEPFGIVPVRHIWERMPVPTLDDDGRPVGWESEADGDTVFGTYRYVFEGEDVTVINGVMTPEPQLTRGEPFGAQGAIFEFPQLSGFQAWPAWVKGGANVSAELVEIGGTVHSLWEGVLVAPSHSQPGSDPVLECTGVVMASDLQKRIPSARTAPRDVGTYVPEVLNAVPSKRHEDIAPMITGIQTAVTGGYENLLTGWTQRILATAIKDGKQLTLACDDRTPELRWKDLDTIAWEIRYGQRNIIVDLGLDYAGAANVLYGTGVNAQGGRWGNWVYPGFHDDTTPPYPFDPPSQSIRVGTTDTDTTTGDGVSLVQAKLGRPITGTFNAGDRTETIRRQRAGGILDDGIVGPQTWAMLFQVGANSGTLAGAFPMPLAANPKVMPRLLGPDGDDLGPNPVYDPTILRVVDEVDYGQGVEKAWAVSDAEERLAIFGKPALAGTITFKGVSPEQLPRQLIREGSNGMVRGHHGQDVKLHVAHVAHAKGSKTTPGTTTLQVDERGRDYPALQALLERDRNATDPAKAAVKRLLRGDITSSRAEYDAESPGGRIVKHAAYGGLWTLARVPMGDYGSVVRVEVTTSAAPTLFSFAILGRAVTANQLVDRVGNPLTATENPWDDDTLDTDLGLLNAWGWAKQKEGVYPKQFSNPDGETAAPVTGRMVVDSTWEYATENGQDLWIATFAASSCFVEGRIYGRD